MRFLALVSITKTINASPPPGDCLAGS